MAAIFEPLIRLHPETMSPMAGLATSYKVERGGTRYTFYLRGHQAPEGNRLPGVESLPAEFTRGRAGGARDVPARWSDGQLITADDLAYSWRRYLALQGPATASRLSAARRRRQALTARSAGATRRARTRCVSRSRWISTPPRRTSCFCAAPSSHCRCRATL